MSKKPIALITGASAGFGYETAKLLAKNGYNIIITARREEKLKSLQAEIIKETGQECLILAFDIMDKNATLDAINNLPENWQQIDLLINNAGLALGVSPAQESNLNQWQQMIDTNISGLVTITHAILPKMIANNSGHIINLGSIAGSYPYLGGNVYGASKAFVKQFSLNLRADLAGTNIRVTNVEPGLCGDTEFSIVRLNGDKQKAAELYENVNYLTPQDIAQTILWIALRPTHININRIEIMPVAQAPAGLKVSKKQ